MSDWDSVRGHSTQVERFRRAIGRNRLGGAFLFTGPKGIGKRLFAHRFAQSLLCEQFEDTEFRFCGQCPSCLQVAAETHLDVLEVRKPEDKAFIPIELLIGERERRMQEGLCHFVSMRPASGRRKVAIIDDADDLNEEGANALLKTLEEPPPKSVLILIGTSPQKQLPTIRSRCQIIRFRPLSHSDLEQILKEQGLATGDAITQDAIRFAEGSVHAAQFWLDENNARFRKDWRTCLASNKGLGEKASERVSELIAEAGKDTWQKRAKLRLAVHVSMEYFRSTLRHELDSNSNLENENNAMANSNQSLPRVSREAMLGCLERCELALQEIGSNANVNLFLDSWISDLDGFLRRDTRQTNTA